MPVIRKSADLRNNMQKVLQISDIQRIITQIAKEFGLTKATLFGSYADGNHTKNSDIDLLVEFTEPSVSLFKLSDLRHELELNLGKKVDLVHAPIPQDSFLEINKEIVLYVA